MGRSSYLEMAQALKTFLEKIIKKLEVDARQAETKVQSNGIAFDLEKQIYDINARIDNARSYIDKLNGIQRYRQKKLETKLPDGSELLQGETELSGNMHNMQTMNQYNDNLYYESIMYSNDGRISYSETLVDNKDAGKVFTERDKENVISYQESDIRIPNTGKKTVFTNAREGSSDLVREDINDESKDIRLKCIWKDTKNRTYDESTPIFDEQGKQIGMLRTVQVYDKENDKSTQRRIEVYDGDPQLSYETSVVYGKDGIESASKYENGKLIQGLSKKRNGQIEITALDKDSGAYAHDTYLHTDGEIVVDGFDNVDSDEIPDFYIESSHLDDAYNPFKRFSWI